MKSKIFAAQIITIQQNEKFYNNNINRQSPSWCPAPSQDLTSEETLVPAQESTDSEGCKGQGEGCEDMLDEQKPEEAVGQSPRSIPLIDILMEELTSMKSLPADFTGFADLMDGL